MNINEEVIDDMGGSFWKKITRSKAEGINAGEFFRIEELEGGMAKLEESVPKMKTKIVECEQEIKLIKKQAKKRLNDEQVRIVNEKIQK